MNMAILAGLLLATTAHSVGGFTIRGGGDEVAVDFMQAAYEAIDEIRKEDPELEVVIDSLLLERTIATAEVFVVDEEVSADIPGAMQASLAINDPATKRIWLNRDRWLAIKSPRMRQAMALHEYLSLEWAERTGSYRLSMRYLRSDGKSLGGLR